jgi:translation initiation factor IF-2
MSDITGGDNKGKLPFRGGQPDRVRQSLSHGRTKSVVVETKRKFNLTGKPGTPVAAPAQPAPPPAMARPATAPAGIAPRGVAPVPPSPRPSGGAGQAAAPARTMPAAPATARPPAPPPAAKAPAAAPAAAAPATAARAPAPPATPAPAAPVPAAAAPAAVSPAAAAAVAAPAAAAPAAAAVEPVAAREAARAPVPAMADAAAAPVRTAAPSAAPPTAAAPAPATGAAAASASPSASASVSTAAMSAPRPAPGTPTGTTARPAPAPQRPAGPSHPAARPGQPFGPAGRTGTPPPRGRQPAKLGRTLSEEEVERRRRAVQAAQASEATRRVRDAEEERRRIHEIERLKAEREQREREEREREIRREREEAAAREAAELAARRASEEKARAEARAARAGTASARPGEAPSRIRPGESPADDRGDTRAPVGPRRDRGDSPETRPRAAKGDSRRSAGKLTITQVLADGEEGSRQRSLAAMRRRQEREKRKHAGPEQREKVVREVRLPDSITVQELANRMAERVAAVVKWLFQNGIMATMNQSIDADTAQLIIEEFGHKVVRVSDADVEDAIETAEDDRDRMVPRAPVVTIMGHVDHGKTSLLDAIRKTNVAAGEAGGITQHIGAYQVETESGLRITFLDTPGHAAFTSMRARGAQVTDIVVLVVAADDGVMPQTVEAISHAKAAGVPLVVAINKCDKPDATPDRVRQDLLRHDVVVEKLSGDVLDVEVSALTGKGLPELLETIALQAEVLDLRANPDRPAEGAVIEAKLDTGRGPIATVLVQRGTLRQGDVFVVGEQWGKVRALVDDKGERVKEAGPSVPVEVLGLSGTPEAGDTLNVVESEAKAREIAAYRERIARERAIASGARSSLDQLLAQAKSGTAVELPVVVKADVQGSAEAIVQSMEKLGNEEVKVRVLHSGVGAITESDITLAEASKALIIGFNVRANASAREAANQKGVEIRYYSIIYDLVDDVKKAASGLLSPITRETFIGYARIKQVFKISGVGKVAGCDVTEGVARRDAGVRLLRDNVVIHTGRLKTLKRFKDEVKEVRAGMECGMAFENYEDIREGDVIEIYTTEEVVRTLA